MIDAKVFATRYGSFWRDAAPALNAFVRRLNLDLYQRVEPPVDLRVESARSALVAETAFQLFSLRALHAELDEEFVEAYVDEAAVKAGRKLVRLTANNVEESLGDMELYAVGELFRRLCGYFLGAEGQQVTVQPKIPGCGIVRVAEADVIVDKALYEVKSVDRDFRSIDIRQLVIYAAMNRAAGIYDIEELGIYNPRKGTEVKLSVEDLCVGISGLSAVELLDSVIYAVAAGDISR